jgi:hypothetical protein
MNFCFFKRQSFLCLFSNQAKSNYFSHLGHLNSFLGLKDARFPRTLMTLSEKSRSRLNSSLWSTACLRLWTLSFVLIACLSCSIVWSLSWLMNSLYAYIPFWLSSRDWLSSLCCSFLAFSISICFSIARIFSASSSGVWSNRMVSSNSF